MNSSTARWARLICSFKRSHFGPKSRRWERLRNALQGHRRECARPFLWRHEDSPLSLHGCCGGQHLWSCLGTYSRANWGTRQRSRRIQDHTSTQREISSLSPPLLLHQNLPHPRVDVNWKPATPWEHLDQQQLETRQPLDQRDGKSKSGGMVSMGSYVYVIRVGKETVKRGRVVVQR